MRRLALLGVVAGTVVALLGGCAGPRGGDPTLRVYAAASLGAAFEEIAEDFEASHEGVEVQLVLGGSSDLVAQIDQGAPADVLATADEATMSTLVSAGLAAGDPEPLATNRLGIAVPPGNPAGISSLADLARPDVQLVTCASEVPCGAAARALAERAGVTLRPVSEEQSVTGVLDKVRSGEADAGLVYVTDLAAAGDDVMGIDVPEAGGVRNVYPVVPVAGSDRPALAQDFVDLARSDQGQDVLARLGFGSP